MLDGGGFLSSVERYDPATNAWGAVAPMGTARAAPAMAVVLEGKLYAVGGQNDEEEEDGDIGILGRCGPSTDYSCPVRCFAPQSNPPPPPATTQPLPPQPP